jgi:hypothetical protein
MEPADHINSIAGSESRAAALLLFVHSESAVGDETTASWRSCCTTFTQTATT